MNSCAVSLLAVLASVLGFAAGCNAGRVSPMTPTPRGTVASGAGIVPGPEAPTPVGAAGGGDVLGPRADGERFPSDLFGAEALYGVNFQERLYSEQSEFASGVLTDASGRLTLPLFVHYVLRSSENGFINWIATPGVQVRIVQVFLDSEGNKRYRYCDALTTETKPDGSNVLFSDLDLRQGGSLSVFMNDPRKTTPVPSADFSAVLADLPSGQTYPTFTQDFVDLGKLFLMQTLSLPTDTGVGPKIPPEGDGLYHLLETPEESVIDTSRLPNIPYDIRFRFPDSSR